MYHELSYISNHKQGLCANDFKVKQQSEFINMEQVVGISELKDFTKPLSGTFVAKYSVVKMNGGECYYITEEEYGRLMAVIKGSPSA